MSACLPIWRRISQPASVEPTASPSGRACEVITKRSRRSISVSTCSSIQSLLPLCAFEQLVNPGFIVFRTVQLKNQFGRSPQMQPVGDFMTNVGRRRTQAFQAALTLLVIALHHDEYSGRTAVLSQHHRGNAY